MACEPPPKLEITETIFDDMAADRDEFKRIVMQYYTYFCYLCGYKPLINDFKLKLMHDHFKRLLAEDSISDHFEIAGALFNSLWRWGYEVKVSDFEELNIVSKMPKELVELLKEHPIQLPAFEFGLSICDYFELEEGEPIVRPAVDANNYDFYKKIFCINLEFNLSEAQLYGRIYRALYTPTSPFQPYPLPE